LYLIGANEGTHVLTPTEFSNSSILGGRN